MHRQGLTPLANVALFMVVTYALHLIWHEFRPVRAEFPLRDIGEWLAQQVFNQSYWFNKNILGLNVTIEPPVTMWFNDGAAYIWVNRGCSGLKQMYHMLFLFLVFPGPWKQKLWFIPTGMLIMFYVNVLRIIALSIVVIWRPEFWNLTHNYIFRYLFYAIMFALWVWWVERYGGFFRKKGVARAEG